MISYWLLILIVILTVILYSSLVINRVSNNKKKIDDYTGFDVAKEVTSNYESINIVNSNDILFSEYNINRNVIRLNSKNYDGNSYIDIAISSILAGFSLVNTDNKLLFKFNFILKKIRSTSFVTLIMLILSCLISNIGDAKIGILLFVLLLIYQYMRYQIIISANVIIKNNLDEKVYSKIENILNNNINFNKLSFIISLVMVLRLVVIILEI